jgi:hypothetical protein
MNITFLIGNGFDRNLGLKTTYSEFIKWYKKTPAKTDTLKKFREYINDNEELWSAAEEELGKYTAQFDAGAGAAFYECHKDICEHLACYLKDEQGKFESQALVNEIENAFSQLKALTSPFHTQEKEVLDAVYTNRRNENVIFNFITYNYTDTLDQCLKLAQKKQGLLGTHKYGTSILNHTVGAIHHVHGTVNSQMVFGVNDKSQIAKPDIFNCEYGDLYEELLIKQQANQGYQENADAKAKKLLNESHILYIYGMSIGTTDKLWWERVCAWLTGNAERHVVLFCYDMPAEGVIDIDRKIAERKARHTITQYSQLDDQKKQAIEPRIHVTNANIFQGLTDIARDTTKEYLAASKEIREKGTEEIAAAIS